MSIIDKVSKKPAKPTTSSGSGWGFLAPVGRFFGAVGRTAGRIFSDLGKVAGPVAHDFLTLAADPFVGSADPRSSEKTILLEPLAKEIVRRGENLPTDVTKLISEPRRALHTISGSLPGLFIPGIATIDQLTSKAGRKEIAEHPGFVALDILPVVGKLKAPLKGLLDVAGTAAAGTKAGMRVGAMAAPVRSKVSLSAAKKAAVPHTIGRTVHETVRSSLDEVLPKLRKLPDNDYAELHQMLIRGEKPPVNHPLRDVYDVVEEHQFRRGQGALSRSVPEEYKQLLKVKSLNHKPSGGYQTYGEQLAEGLAGLGLGEDAAEHVIRTMTQAFLDDAPNPLIAHPQFNKTWTKIYSHYRGQLRRAESSYGRLYDEPVTGGKYASAEMKALRRQLSAPGRGVNLTQVGREAASEVHMAREFRRFSETKGSRNLNDFLAWKQNDLRRHYPQATDAQIRATIDRYGRYASQGASESTVAYVDAVKSMPPGSYQAYLDDFHRRQRAILNQRLTVPGFGPASARKAVEELSQSMNANIMELVAKGQRPVWLPRRAKASALEPVEGSPLPRSSKVPGSMKSSQGLAADYIDDMGYMMVADEAADALQHTTLKVVAQLWSDSGAHSYTSARHALRDAGFSVHQADSLIRKRYDSFDLTTDGKVSIAAARDGALLVPKEIGIHLRHMFNPPKHALLADKFLKYWMIPTLALAPAFHLNNVIGGAIMTALRVPAKNPVRLIDDFRSAFAAARKGQIIDPRIPTGRGFMPMLKDFMSPRDEAIAADLYGRGLVEAVKHWFASPDRVTRAVKGAPRTVLDVSERANKFLDELYRNFTAIARSPEFKTTGKLSDEGIAAAQRLMQDYDTMIPFEREVLQRLFPFWTWKRSLIRWATTYPMDHPVRVTVLNQMARWHEDQRDVSEWLDDFLMNAIPIGDEDAEGFRKYVSIRGMNPFSDFSNMATIKGWIQSAHPLIQAGAKTFGFDPFLGGVPAHSRKDDTVIDPQTGAQIRRLTPDAVIEVVPQLRALQRWVGAPPPDEDTMAGWYGWWKKYGAALRLLPSLVYINTKEEDRRHRELETPRPGPSAASGPRRVR